MLPRIENPNGVYYAWFKHDDPYTGKPGRVHYFYYDSTKENMPTPPRSWRDVADPYAKSVQMVERRVQVVRNRNNAEEAKVERSIRALVDKKNKDDNERLIKARNAGSGGLDGMDEDDDDDSNEDDKSNGEEKLNNQNHMGWLSSEAGMLFLGSKDADGDVVDILQERIGELTNVVQAVDGYKSVGKCTDFAEEVPQLEAIGKKLGCSVIITTKYHAEYAGEGIEYSWGLAKCFYRRQPLSKKKKKANFFALVDQCLSQELLTKDMVRKFSKRARDYMLAYRAFETDEMKGGMKDSGKPLDITHHMIEKMKKVVSSHRAALDHDRGYLDKIIKEECFDLVRFVVKSESKSLPVKREESSGETSRKSSRKRTKTSRG